MRRSPNETAILLALMLHRSGKSRARVSKRTLEVISKRERIHASFVGLIRSALDDLDVVLLESNRGGYAMVTREALDGAPPISSSIIANDLKALRREEVDYETFLEELGMLGTREEEEEDEE